MRVLRLKRSQIPAWLRLRSALWPSISTEVHHRQMADILADEEFNAVFVAVEPSGKMHGFVEVSLRLRAEGCKSSPVGFVEAWYVAPDSRHKGIGRAMLAKAESWAASQGCREMASNADMENEGGRSAHRALGYEEVARLAHFRKPLPKVPAGNVR
ncbi:MAG TPA: GNAT family N-acetyltransferase [Anaerolineales bacterium]|nr:GNAT family N-acetyltransferase [Anaerolineales bacterium]